MDILALSAKTYLITRPVLAAGTTTTLSTSNAITGYVNGVSYNASAWNNTATPTTDLNTGATFVGVPANYGSVFVVGINSSGTMKACQGQVAALDAAGNFITAPQPPALPDGFLPCGTVVIKCGSTASTWTFGSSNMSGATGVTYSFADHDGALPRPVVA
jgi:hypothetical protein